MILISGSPPTADEGDRALNNVRKRKPEEEEIKRLESFLFGSISDSIGFCDPDDDDDDCRDSDPVMFDVSREKPVWVDEEEEKVVVDISRVNRLRKLRKHENETLISGPEYVLRLRAQHAKLNPWTDWAAVPISLDDTESILCSAEDLVEESSGSMRLLPGVLENTRLKDVNADCPSGRPVNSVEFHRNSQLLLVAGFDRRVRFFQVDGVRNLEIQSLFLEDCPVRKAAFFPDGSRAVAAGKKRFFYTIDLVRGEIDRVGSLTGREEMNLETFEVSPDSSIVAFAGDGGSILLVSAASKDLVGTLKMNGTVISLAFASSDGCQLLSSGSDGHIYVWDLRMRACIHKGVDEGSFGNSSLCYSSSRGIFATGLECGVVNVYDHPEFLAGKRRRPLKAVENLTTRVSFMRFNHDAQVLAVCSSVKKNGMKLVHIPSLTVFSNWPHPRQNLRYPRCLDFSPLGGFMAIGNGSGDVLLYKLHHYHQA